jgi:neurofibromin 1
VFREELAIIREAVSAQFPESKYIAVGGFVFLRLFGPAILTPENANFSKVAIPRNPNVRRLLLQATRVMQNLANNVLFGAKETHMIALNDFLTNNIYKVTNFLRAISTLPTEENVMTSASVRLDQTSYVKLHKYLSDNLERMSRRLTSRRKLHNGGGLAEIQALLGWKKTLDRLSTLLGQLGQPSDLPASELVQTGTSAPISGGMNFYMEFIRRNQNRDLTFVKNLNCFYLGGKSKGGRPVFYIICRLLDTEGLDHELLVFYMMRVSVFELFASFRY